MEIDLNKRYQTMLTLWFALLASVGMYFLFIMFAAPEFSDVGHAPSSALILGLSALGTLLVIVSFPVKHKLLDRAVEAQDVGLVQRAMIVACAMCELSALLGVVERLVFGSRQYYFLFLLAAAGQVLHFPRRSQLEAAQWRTIKSSTLRQ